MGQCLGHLVEGEGSVDVDAEVTRYAEVGYRFEVRRPFLDGEYTQPAVREPTGHRADRQYAQQRRYRSANAPVTATGASARR
jgi:hypothetical protein